LHLAALHDAARVVNLLLTAGIILQTRALKTNETALHFAARENSTSAIRFLCSPMKALGLLDAQNLKGETALRVALKSNHATTACLLIKTGARVDLVDQNLMSPEIRTSLCPV
jgi:ankyrin repeat protein